MRTFRQYLQREDAALLPGVLSAFPSLAPILRGHGIDPSSLRFIAQGDKGSAFQAGDHIVKITEDKREARASANLLGKDIHGVNRIHFVGRLKGDYAHQDRGDSAPIKTRYYVIIQDLLDVEGVTLREREVADAVGDYFLLRSIPQDPTAVEVKERIKKEYPSLKKSVLAGRTYDDILDEVLGIVKILKDHHVEFLDLRGENIGKDRRGRLTVFDLGVSRSPEVQFTDVE